jgi:hypothetical protein
LGRDLIETAAELAVALVDYVVQVAHVKVNLEHLHAEDHHHNIGVGKCGG